MDLTEQIKQKALSLGFDLVGVTDASPIDAGHARILYDWLECNCAHQQTGMAYMSRNIDKRLNPVKLLESARSVICVGLNYKPAEKPQQPAGTVACGHLGRVADYAQYEDYHPFIKGRLRSLAVFINELVGGGLAFRICVDSAPVAERSLACRAGLGFIGKNHILINPRLGGQILLGEMITNIEMEPDEQVENRCSNCDKCISACPTGALKADGRFDSGSCISYLTIEYKGQISSERAVKIGDHLFGCSECIRACPFQDSAAVCANRQFKFFPDRAALSLEQILNMSQSGFDSSFADSAINRIGLEKLKRNAEICLANLEKDAKG